MSGAYMHFAIGGVSFPFHFFGFQFEALNARPPRPFALASHE